MNGRGKFARSVVEWQNIFECKYQPAAANKALIMDVNRPGKKLKHVTVKSKANYTASQNQDDGSDEETRYQGSFSTKAT